MKQILTILLMVIFVTIANAQATNSADTNSGKVLRHVVLFKFKDNVSEADKHKLEAAFKALPSKIKEIKSFEWGINNSPENLNQGLTHCFLVTFSSAVDRDNYLPHPAHKAFVKEVGDLIDKVTVVDYWAEK